MESNDSPEIPDRGETSDIPGLPLGWCRVWSFNVIAKRCKAAHAWVVSGAIEISIYYYYYYSQCTVDFAAAELPVSFLQQQKQSYHCKLHYKCRFAAVNVYSAATNICICNCLTVAVTVCTTPDTQGPKSKSSMKKLVVSRSVSWDSHTHTHTRTHAHTHTHTHTHTENRLSL